MERDGRWRRLHQEDFCQILGVSPAAKYETNQTGVRGPGLADMFAALRRLASGQDVANLLDMVIFNVNACNKDAHAKNYELLIGEAGNRYPEEGRVGEEGGSTGKTGVSGEA